MGRILGLDLGTNSIGWAILNDNQIETTGIKVFPDAIRSEKRNLRRIKQRILIRETQLTENSLFFKLRKYLNENYKTVILTTITVQLFLFALLFPSNWQFWINLGIGSLIATLSLSNN